MGEKKKIEKQTKWPYKDLFFWQTVCKSETKTWIKATEYGPTDSWIFWKHLP